MGGLNIDECRVPLENGETKHGGFGQARTGFQKGIGNSGDKDYKCEWVENTQGRFPANIIHDGSDEATRDMPKTHPTKPHNGDGKPLDTRGNGWGFKRMPSLLSDNGGSASRYFYTPKASKRDRDEGLDEFELVSAGVGALRDGNRNNTEPRRNVHPTVKPTALMQYLVRLVCPKGSVILDPFMGSGSTGKAVAYENKERNAGYSFIGIEQNPEYVEIAKARIEFADIDNTTDSNVE